MTRALSTALLMVTCYALWLATIALAAPLVLMVKSGTTRLLVLARWSPWALGLVDKVSIAAAGLLWLIFVIVVESYYRTGATSGAYPLLMRRALVTGGALSLILLVLGVAMAALRSPLL